MAASPWLRRGGQMVEVVVVERYRMLEMLVDGVWPGLASGVGARRST